MKIAAGPCFAWTGRTGTARLVILHDFPTSGLSMVAHGCAGATIHGMLIMDGANRHTVKTAAVFVINLKAIAEGEGAGVAKTAGLRRPKVAVAN